MECEHAVSALKKAVADAKGAHRTSAFASEAVTAAARPRVLVAAARRTRPSPPRWRTSPPCAEVSAIRLRARPTPTPPRPSGDDALVGTLFAFDRFDVDENLKARPASPTRRARPGHRRATHRPVTTVRLRSRGSACPRPERPPPSRVAVVLPAGESRVARRATSTARRARRPPLGHARQTPARTRRRRRRHGGMARRASVADFVDGRSALKPAPTPPRRTRATRSRP